MGEETPRDDSVEIDGELIKCVSCEVTFLFGGGEKEFFLSKGLQSPKRCGPCRRARREGRQFEAQEEILPGEGES